MTWRLATVLPDASTSSIRNVASNTFAMPLTVPGLPRLAPQAGRSTKIAGSWSRKSLRTIGRPAGVNVTPSPPKVDVGTPSSSNRTPSTVENWVSV